MTICRCEVAIPMLRDIFATWDDWHGELQTVTGYEWEKYQDLFDRISDSSRGPLSVSDEAMLKQAAIQFSGYPGVRTDNLKAAFGDVWKDTLDSAFRQEQKY